MSPRHWLCLGTLAAGAWAAGAAAPESPRGDQEAAAMRRVAARFTGTPGVFLHLGDSLTFAGQNTAWARRGRDHDAAVAAFLEWSHCGARDATDGWHLASADVTPGRSHTAASGARADEYLSGGKHGLPGLAELIRAYNPQMALCMLGSNDLLADRPVDRYIRDVERAVDLLMANGTIPILSTLPPCRNRAEQVIRYNAALRALAASKHLPLIDLYAEMNARAGAEMELRYLGADGIHLSTEPAEGPASAENLGRCGYLLRCYLAVLKGMEVKARILDAE